MARWVNRKKTIIELSYQNTDKEECKLEMGVESLKDLKQFINDNNLDQIEKGHALVSTIYSLVETKKPAFLYSLQFSVDGKMTNGPNDEPARLTANKGYINAKFYLTDGKLHDPAANIPSVQFFRPDGSLEKTLSHDNGNWRHNGPNGKAIDCQGNVTRTFNESVGFGRFRVVNMFTPLQDALTEPKRRMETKSIHRLLKPVSKAESFPA